MQNQLYNFNNWGQFDIEDSGLVDGASAYLCMILNDK